MHLRPDFPVVTARLRLRPVEAGDAGDLVAYRSLPEVCRYVPFEPQDLATVERSIAGRMARREITGEGQPLVLGIELAPAGPVIGDLMLVLDSVEHRSGEVGWVLHPGHSGRGYAIEAVHALLHLAFDDLGLHRAVARVDARNDPSLRLADRLGMRREAYLVANEWFKGGWSDEVDFALLDTEWAAQHEGGRPAWCAHEAA